MTNITIKDITNFDKPFSVKFKIDFKLLAILYVCYRYNFPIAYFISFYQMYGAQALFVLKALSCNKKISLNDATFLKIITDSKQLHTQIIEGVSTNIKIKQYDIAKRNGYKIKEERPEDPKLNLESFSDDYKGFIQKYLQKYITNIFSEVWELNYDTQDLYVEITKK